MKLRRRKGKDRKTGHVLVPHSLFERLRGLDEEMREIVGEAIDELQEAWEKGDLRGIELDDGKTYYSHFHGPVVVSAMDLDADLCAANEIESGIALITVMEQAWVPVGERENSTPDANGGD